jgi:phosphate transport system substrate-binding protein
LNLKNKIIILAAASLTILVMVLAGCRSNPATATAISSPGASSSLSGTITESGSTTVQPLAEKLANAFTVINPKVKVIIQGGGSSVGVKAANDGTVDLGAASRELSATDPKLITYLLARDGIALIINPGNTVNGLTKAQIKDIYSGKITRWSQVGGADKEIHVAAREEGSGTRTAFEEMVMGKDTTIVKSAILQSSNGALLQVVKSDVDAIGFVSFGYLTDKSIKAVTVDSVEATEANAKSGTYPIVRPLYFLTKNQPAGLVKSFLDYCTSPAAQKIVADEGYVSVN